MPPLYIDFSFTKPPPAAVKASGYVGVIGYFSNTPAKNLTAAEAAGYRAAGLDVVKVWESTGTDPLQGAAAGNADAEAAEAQAAAEGYPTDHPIFYATDFGPSAAQMSAVLAYYRGVAAAHRTHGFGPYGSARVVEAVASLGIAPSAYWQTVAWSGGVIAPMANLYQRVSPTLPPIPGGGYDEDVLIIPFVKPAPAPTPAPQPTPPTQEDDMLTPIVEFNGQDHQVQRNTSGLIWHFWRGVEPSAPWNSEGLPLAGNFVGNALLFVDRDGALTIECEQGAAGESNMVNKQPAGKPWSGWVVKA